MADELKSQEHEQQSPRSMAVNRDQKMALGCGNPQDLASPQLAFASNLNSDWSSYLPEDNAETFREIKNFILIGKEDFLLNLEDLNHPHADVDIENVVADHGVVEYNGNDTWTFYPNKQFMGEVTITYEALTAEHAFSCELLFHKDKLTTRLNTTLDLDGDSGHVTTYDPLTTVFAKPNNRFNISLGVNPDSLKPDQSLHRVKNVIVARANNSQGYSFEIGIDEDGSLLIHIDQHKNNEFSVKMGEPGTIKIAENNFISVSFDGVILTANINGQIYTQEALWMYTDALSGQPDRSGFVIGATTEIDTFLDGQINSVMVYKDTLSEIQMNALQSGQEITNGLKLYFDFTSDNPLIDLSTNSLQGILNGGASIEEAPEIAEVEIENSIAFEYIDSSFESDIKDLEILNEDQVLEQENTKRRSLNFDQTEILSLHDKADSLNAQYGQAEDLFEFEKTAFAEGLTLDNFSDRQEESNDFDSFNDIP
jgi:hypothetical protein